MSRYYFHLQDGSFVQDDRGVELPTAAEAQDVAVQTLVEALKGNSQALWETENFRVIVTDASRLTLFSIELTAVVAPALRADPGPG
jgi:hypothetical protein